MQKLSWIDVRTQANNVMPETETLLPIVFLLDTWLWRDRTGLNCQHFDFM